LPGVGQRPRTGGRGRRDPRRHVLCRPPLCRLGYGRGRRRSGRPRPV